MKQIEVEMKEQQNATAQMALKTKCEIVLNTERCWGYFKVEMAEG